ncbi:MAG: RsmE family RNA methyltransferase [Alphaproteobacteria bacterium]|nr:MAG: hypothetical protein B6I23_02475 [Rickettsiaceae bacterium 4572_127]
MIRIYCKNSLEKRLSMTGDNFHYLSKVMRIKKGFSVLIFNQNDGEFLYKISEIYKKEIVLTRKSKNKDSFILPQLELAFAPIRKNRLSFLIEKATELGATKLHPVLTDHTQYRELNLERLEKITIEATEQCGRFSPPEISPILSFDEFLKLGKFFIYLNEKRDENTPLISKELLKNQVVLVGPEGGFSEAELEMLSNDKKAIPTSLGKLILRTETAGIKALSVLNS